MPRHATLPLLLALASVTACDASSGPKKLSLDDDDSGGLAATALDHTPGYFRDVFRKLEAQAELEAVEAAEVIAAELVSRNLDPGELPALCVASRDTLDGLLAFGLRAVQETGGSPTIARKIGRHALETSLGLDPALVTFNANGGAAEITDPGAATLAGVVLAALESAAHDAPVICASLELATDAGSSFDPGEPEVVWVEGACEEDEWVEGYCEPDTWIDGECYEEWIPEQCSGGEWVDEGWYEWYCYDYDDCEYVWREDWVYYDGDCTDGYWDEWCDSGRWEPGLCYDGYWIYGDCEDGHFEYTYPDGDWEFSALVVPEECTQVRPQQYAIALAGARVIADEAYRDLPSEWRSALDALLAAAPDGAPDEGVYEAALQVLEAAQGS